jgi:hypothetical protein
METTPPNPPESKLVRFVVRLLFLLIGTAALCLTVFQLVMNFVFKAEVGVRWPIVHLIALVFFLALVFSILRRMRWFDRFWNSLFTWRSARRALVGLAIFATLLAIFYAEENWRGKRAWENCKHDLEAKGEVLDWAPYISAPIPDEENIIKSPKMAGWFVKPRSDKGYSNELSAALSTGTLSKFAQQHRSNAVAEVTVVSPDNIGDFASADLVLQMQCQLLSLAPTNLTSIRATESPPVLTVFDDVPLTKAITNQAWQAGLNVEWDSNLLSQWHSRDHRSREPNVSFRLENLSARQVLFRLLRSYGLRWSEEPRTGIVRITRATPSDPEVIVDAGARMRLQQLFQRSLMQSADGSVLPSLNASQGFKLVAGVPAGINPFHVVLLAEEELPKGLFQEAFGRGIGDLADYGGNGWHSEPTASNHFRIFLGRDQVFYAADYLAWSDRFASELELIRQALKRPHIRMEGDFQRPFEIPIVNFVNIRIVAQTAAQRAQCCLLLGRSEQAFHELSLICESRRLLAAKPTTLVAAMIDVAICGLYVQTIADGFRLQAWREPELVALQQQLSQINLLPAVADSFRGERAAVCHTFQTISASELAETFSLRDLQGSLWGKLSNPVYLLLKFAPRGWVYQNLVTIATEEQATCAEIVEPNAQLIQPGKAAEMQRDFGKMSASSSPFNILAHIAVPNLSRATQTLALNQTKVNQAVIACGLERYRHAHGDYPKTLDMLVPQFVGKLPHDLIGGQLLRYRRTDDGKFLLYSVGWNEADDGGTATLRKDGSNAADTLDWVWQPLAP